MPPPGELDCAHQSGACPTCPPTGSLAAKSFPVPALAGGPFAYAFAATLAYDCKRSNSLRLAWRRNRAALPVLPAPHKAVITFWNPRSGPWPAQRFPARTKCSRQWMPGTGDGQAHDPLQTTASPTGRWAACAPPSPAPMPRIPSHPPETRWRAQTMTG